VITLIDSIQDARERLEEYDLEAGMDIDDIIQECADAGVDVYYKDLFDWVGAGDNLNYVEDAIDEFGWEGVGGEMTKAYQMGQYIRNEQLLRDAWEEIEAELEEKEEAEEERLEAEEEAE